MTATVTSEMILATPVTLASLRTREDSTGAANEVIAPKARVTTTAMDLKESISKGVCVGKRGRVRIQGYGRKV